MRDKLMTVVSLVGVAIATGWQQLYHLMWALYGAPTSAIQYVGLSGSLVLLLAAILAFIRIGMAHQLASLATILIWVFYAPAVWALVQDRSNAAGLLSAEPWVYLPPILLAALSVFLLRSLKHAGGTGKASAHEL